VLERDERAGGTPLACGHLGFGIFDLRRLLTGPAYARALVAAAGGAEIRTNVSALSLAPGGVVVSGRDGVETLGADAVLLATGIRETPRSARLVSGARPWGVTTTGAFQDMVYRGGQKPFERPIVVGSELVAFSALVTARHAGVRPVAMIEEGERIAARRPADLLARVAFGVPVITGARLLAIHGGARVERVTIERAGAKQEIACDGVIFSGDFTPEATFVRASGLAIDPLTGGPVIDAFWRCSAPSVFAAGNLLRAVEHSGFVAGEGGMAAEAILADLAGKLPDPAEAVAVGAGGAIAYVTPQRVYPAAGPATLRARVKARFKGEVRVLADDKVVLRFALSALPHRRLTFRLPAEALDGRRSILVTTE
jgi:thioredoxin reductase